MPSNGVLTQPERDRMLDPELLYQAVMQIIGRDLGLDQHGSKVNHVSYESDTEYAHTLKNAGTGGHLNIPNVAQFEDSGETVNNLVVSGTLAAGDTTLASLLVTGNTQLGNDATSDTLTVNSITTINGVTAVRANMVVGNTVPTNLLTLVVTAGAQTALIGAAAAPNLYADVQNGRTLIGSTTALTTANNDKFAVIGGSAYFASATDETAIGVRYAPTATGSFFFGAGGAVTPNTPDGVFKNAGGTQIARMFNSGGMAIGVATAPVGSETLLVQGQSLLQGATTVTTGGLTVTAGGATVTGASTFHNLVTIDAGGLAVSSGGITMSGPTNIDGNGGTAGQIRYGAGIFNAASLSGTESLRVGGSALIDAGITAQNATWNGTNSVFLLNGTTQTLTTVGAAGGASALPATPLGYIKIVAPGGVAASIPFYNR